MPPNPRVTSAFRAMKDLGIGEEKVKPVLKRLLKLYDKNWEPIEEDYYRVLLDAIFDEDDSKLEEEPRVPEETARPLKRLRLRNQVPPSVSDSNHGSGGALVRKPKVEDELPDSETRTHLEAQDVELSQSNSGNIRAEAQSFPTWTYARNKGKQPALSEPSVVQERSDPAQQCATRSEAESLGLQIRPGVKRKESLPTQAAHRETISVSERASREVLIKEPLVDRGIVSMPKQKAPSTYALIIPKDEPFSDHIFEYEVPIAQIHPDPSSNGDSLTGSVPILQAVSQELPASNCIAAGNRGECDLASFHEITTNSEVAMIVEETPSNLDIASSSTGEVKISLSCNSAVPDFHMPSLDAVVKLMEDKCLRSYKILDPNFSVMKLLEDMCECVLELGTDATHESQERANDVTQHLDLLNKSPARDVFDIGGNKEIFTLSGSVNIQCSMEIPAQKIPRLPPSLNTFDDCIEECEEAVVNGYAESNKEKELEGPASTNSHVLVVVPNTELTSEELRSLHDANDITRGEERISIAWVNEINRECPPSFHYMAQNLVFQNADVTFCLSRVGDDKCCSTCFGNCLLSSTPCSCARDTGGEYAYASEGLLKEEFLEKCISINRDPQQQSLLYCKECPLEKPKEDDIMETCKGHLGRKFIKECWSKCGCNKQCGNRVVQRGISCNLQVFLTPEGKGWGLRTLEVLQKGAFVCEYVGEILTNVELYERNMRSSNKHAYSALLDADWGSGALNNERALCLDAKDYGNVARFINHRCLDANLVEVPVEVETPDHHYYHLALFTTRNVDAYEELTWDYGLDFDDRDHPVKAFRCQCGSKFCRNMKRSNRSRSTLISR